MKKSSSKGCYNLRQKFRAISGSTQKKSTENQLISEEDIEYFNRSTEDTEENIEPCQLCLQESQDNQSTNHVHEIETENHIPPSTDQSESPSILHAVNAANGTPETVLKPRAERTSLSSESSSSQTESDSEDSIEETTPLISTTKHPRILFSDKPEGNSQKLKELNTEKQGKSAEAQRSTSLDKSSSEESLTVKMDSQENSDLQQQIRELQRQVSRHLKTTPPVTDYPSIADFSSTKPSLFHGYENENVERWIEKFKLHLTRRRINLAHNAAASELALHLAGPAEVFYYSLRESQRLNFEDLCTALRERYSSRNHTWRQWQALSSRQQGANEPLDKYIADLHAMFQHLNLSEEEKLRYFVQGLRPDTRREVLIKQPQNYRDAEDAARLLQMVDSTIRAGHSSPNQLNDKIIEAVVKATIAAQGGAKGAPEPKIAAYQPEQKIRPDDEVSYLREQNRKLNDRLLANENQNIAAYQPAARESYRSNNESEELHRLREEIRLLKAVQRGPQQIQSNRSDDYGRNDSYRDTRTDFSQAMDEIRKMQSRIDGFMRTYANKNNRQEQPRVRNQEGRPICYHCGKLGHVRQNCYSRGQQYQNYKPQVNQPHEQTTPRIAVIEAEPAEEQVLAQFDHQQQPKLNISQTMITNENGQTSQAQTRSTSEVPNTVNEDRGTDQQFCEQNKQGEKAGNVYYARRSKPLPSTSTVNNEVPTINTIDAEIVEGPTTHKESDDHNTEVKPHPAITPKQCAQVSSSPEEYTAPVHENQAIVIWLEIFTDKLNTSKETTAPLREVQTCSRSEPTIVVKDQTVKSPNDPYGLSRTETFLQPKEKLDRQLQEQGAENKKTEVHFQSGNLRQDFPKPQKLQPSEHLSKMAKSAQYPKRRLLQTSNSDVTPLSMEKYVVVTPTS